MEVLLLADRGLVRTECEEGRCIPVTMTFILEATAKVRTQSARAATKMGNSTSG